MRLTLPSKPKSVPVHKLGNGFELHGLPELLDKGVVGLLGGYGKTTALLILAGKSDPSCGWYTLLQKHAGTALGKFLRLLDGEELRVSYKPQAVERLRHLPDMHRDLSDLKLDFDVVHALRLGGYETKSLEKLDAAELQRISIAAALSKDADIYIFDEPSQHLDIEQRFRIAKMIKEKGKKAAVVVADSDITFLRMASDAVSIFYGDEAWSVPSKLYGPKDGIASFAYGMLPNEKIRIRETATGEGPAQRAKRTATTGELVVELAGLQKKFDGSVMRVADTEILSNERVGLIGADGTGKSSLLKIIAGKETEFSGLARGKARVSYKPQHLPQRAVLKGLPKETLQALGIPLRGRPRLTQSLRQRIAIARCLGADADVYVLDQPSDGLSAEHRLAVAELLRAKRCVVVADHDARLAAHSTDRVGLAATEKGVVNVRWMRAEDAIAEVESSARL